MSSTTAPTFSERIVDRLTRPGKATDQGRRGFLQRTTLVATALTVNPFDFILKPVSAYASVCGSANECSDGWTAFCCTINEGKNTCPPGSYAAGWWKVTDSTFCRGSARYYIDCNRHPTEGTCSCSCADGQCDRRRTCCNNFRYGQCNQHIKGVTPVVCRVITCMPPWKWDKTCTRTKLYSPATRTHSASCLPGEWPSHIEIKYQDMGLVGSVLGAPTTREKNAAGGGRFRKYQAGVIMWRAGLGAREVRNALAHRYNQLGRESSPLGYPTTDRKYVGDGRGRYNKFEHGDIHWSKATGAWETVGPVAARYRALKGPRGRLGYPVTGDELLGDDVGHTTLFENGRIMYGPETGAWAVRGPTWRAYEALGGPSGEHGFGYPTADTRRAADGGHRSDFEGGSIIWKRGVGAHGLWGRPFRRYEQLGAEGGPLGYPTRSLETDARGESVVFERGGIYYTEQYRARVVHEQIHARYLDLGGHLGPLGYPMWNDLAFGDGSGRQCRFEGGWIWWSAPTGARVVSGAIAMHYKYEEGGPTGWLGYPTTDLQVLANGTERCEFQNGVISHDPATGEINVDAT